MKADEVAKRVYRKLMHRLGERARTNVTDDIVAYKIEESEGEMTDEEIDKLVCVLKKKSDVELADWWYGTVGEWLCSLSTIRNVDEQFRKLISGMRTDYGFVY